MAEFLKVALVWLKTGKHWLSSTFLGATPGHSSASPLGTPHPKPRTLALVLTILAQGCTWGGGEGRSRGPHLPEKRQSVCSVIVS